MIRSFGVAAGPVALLAAWSLAGCGAPPPAVEAKPAPALVELDAPPGKLVRAALRDDRLFARAPDSETLSLGEPTGAGRDALEDLLRGRLGVVIDVPPETAWQEVFPLISAADAVKTALALQSADRVLPTGDPTRSIRPTVARCADEAKVAPGRLVTLDIGSDGSASWLRGTVRFEARVSATEGRLSRLAESSPKNPEAGCWPSDGCLGLFTDAMERAACTIGSQSTEHRATASLGGRNGCLLEVLRPTERTALLAGLAAQLDALGLAPDDDVLVLPEASVPFQVVTDLFAALHAAGRTPPILARTLVHDGRGAPMCDAGVQDAEDLRMAGAWWLGNRMVGAAPATRPR